PAHSHLNRVHVQDTPGHPYARVHGHSFSTTITLAAADLGEHGWVADFAQVKSACEDVRQQLDHQFLNAIPTLERPTLERMAEWIYEALLPQLPNLKTVEVARPTLSERVRYCPHG
ncbi:MAG: 6-carboxytetrahydropterin synthase, partial [Pseudomonadota bacterium]